jgi:hypothetical protein
LHVLAQPRRRQGSQATYRRPGKSCKDGKVSWIHDSVTSSK